MPIWIGKTLGKVHVDKLLGRGGMAEVYLGTHTTLQRPVAVKFLHGYLEENTDLFERFQREARVVAGLRHPNIIQVFDYDLMDERPYIVMEYVNGPSLAAYLKSIHERGERMSLGAIRRLLPLLASALDYAHKQGVIHRDIKPANVLLYSKSESVELGTELPPDTEPLLADFGLVRVLDAAKQTSSGLITGTPAYMSPEQARGEHADHRSDVYSFGVLLYEMLSGRVPFEADTPTAIMNMVLYEPPPPIASLSPVLQAVIDRALHKNPNLRYQSAGELSRAFLNALGMAAEGLTLPPILPVPPPIRPAPSPAAPAPRRERASRRMVWEIGALAMLILAGVAWGARNFLVAAPASPSATEASIATELSSLPQTPSANESPGAMEPQSIGVLRFQDVAGIADGVTMFVNGMPFPPEGMQYEVWLIADDGEARRSLGVMSLEKDGSAALNFVDEQSRNLLEQFSRMEVSLEPSPDPRPSSTENAVYSSGIPINSLKYIRRLIVSYSDAPDRIGIMQGLRTNASLIDRHVKAVFDSFDAGDEAGMRAHAEAALNLIVGSRDVERYGDWDGDGTVNDPGDGFGLLSNGDSPGYMGEALVHTDFAMQTGDAPANAILHGGHVKVSIQNVGVWSAQLRDLLAAILQSPFDESLRDSIVQAAGTADQILNGVDLNRDGIVSPVLGEGGTLTAYEHAYYMADMIVMFGKDQVMPPAPTFTPTIVLNPPPTLQFTGTPASAASASPSPTLSNSTLPPPTSPLPTLPLPTSPLPTAPLPTAPLPTAPLPTAPLPTLPVPSLLAPTLPDPTISMTPLLGLGAISKPLTRILLALFMAACIMGAVFYKNVS